MTLRARAILLLLTGCARPVFVEAPLSAPRDVVIDWAFAADDADAIRSSIDGWARLGVPIREVSGLDAWAFGVGPYAIHIIARTTIDTCGSDDVPGVVLGCFFPPNRIELAVDSLARVGGWKSVPAHELGHALGLRDVTIGRSVMRGAVVDQAEGPTELDAQALRDRRE